MIMNMNKFIGQNEAVILTEPNLGAKEVAAEITEIISWRGRCFMLKVGSHRLFLSKFFRETDTYFKFPLTCKA